MCLFYYPKFCRTVSVVSVISSGSLHDAVFPYLALLECELLLFLGTLSTRVLWRLRLRRFFQRDIHLTLLVTWAALTVWDRSWVTILPLFLAFIPLIASVQSGGSASHTLVGIPITGDFVRCIFLVGLEWDLRVCISNKLPGSTNASAPRTSLGVARRVGLSLFPAL